MVLTGIVGGKITNRLCWWDGTDRGSVVLEGRH
jgi:hypothetical protein